MEKKKEMCLCLLSNQFTMRGTVMTFSSTVSSCSNGIMFLSIFFKYNSHENKTQFLLLRLKKHLPKTAILD